MHTSLIRLSSVAGLLAALLVVWFTQPSVAMTSPGPHDVHASAGTALVSGVTPRTARSSRPITLPIAVDGALRTHATRSSLATGGVIVRDFEPPSQRWLAGHRGIDFAAAPGTAVFATAPGVVKFAGMVAGKPTIVIAHANGTRSTFEPVDATVSVGTPVVGGDQLGYTAQQSQSHCTQHCVHVGLKYERDYSDPFRAMQQWTRIVLLP